MGTMMIAALFVETNGIYFGEKGVDAWCELRDARKYTGPYSVVAHPPCQRWGRYWHGSPCKPHQFRLGEDQGCFASALTAVRNYGGVLEHPAYSKAWDYFGIVKPKGGAGWIKADTFDGWTCQVEQGHYGHISRKLTWLYSVGTNRPELDWSKGEQRLHPAAVKRHGYEKARRIGIMAMIGGKDKTTIRNSTPAEFMRVLLAMADMVEIET